MEKDKLLTIVIPYFNSRFFKETLKSLYEQTDKNFCVFVGNDNSPDDPTSIIEFYKEDLNISYKKFNENFGKKDLTLQWKRCINEVSTPFFMILGDDDKLSHDSVEEIHKVIKYGEKAYVYRLSMLRVDEDNNQLTGLINYNEVKNSKDFIVKRANNEVLSSLGEYVFSTVQFEKYGIMTFPKAFYSDNMMVLQYSEFGKVVNIPEAISIVRVSKYSISGNEKNDIDIKKAASQFYFKLFRDYGNEFEKKDIQSFLPYILYGYKHNLLPINIINLFGLLFKYNGFPVVKDILVKKLQK